MGENGTLPEIKFDPRFIEFMHKVECERCGGDLRVRGMSWFTFEAICGDCIEKEKAIRLALIDRGEDLDALENCGYVPRLDKSGKIIGKEWPKHRKRVRR